MITAVISAIDYYRRYTRLTAPAVVSLDAARRREPDVVGAARASGRKRRRA